MPASNFQARWINRAAPRGMAHRYIDALLLGAMLILMVFDTAIGSYFEFFFFGDNALGPCLMVCICIILFFAGVAFFEREIVILALFASIIAFLLSYYLYFNIGNNRPINFNGLGIQYGSLMVIVFYVLAKHKLLPAAMKIIFYIYVTYIPMYVALVVLSDTGSLPSFVSQRVSFIWADPERGTRILMHAAAGPYVVMYSVAKLQEKVRLQYIATLGLASYAFYLALSRGITICVVVVLVLYLITRRIKFVQTFSFIAYLLVALYLSIGVVNSEFNPYSFSKSDTSTVARSYEYDVIVPYIRNNPFFGVGLPDATPGRTYYLGALVYPDDLGIIGIWFNFGLIGIVLISIIGIYFCCMQNIKRSSAVLGSANARALSLVGCALGLYSVMAGILTLVPLFSLIIANSIYNAKVVGEMKRTSKVCLRARTTAPLAADVAAASAGRCG
jgi:hypothetical protein